MMRTFLMITIILFVSCLEQKARTESIGRYSLMFLKNGFLRNTKGLMAIMGTLPQKMDVQLDTEAQDTN